LELLRSTAGAAAANRPGGCRSSISISIAPASGLDIQVRALARRTKANGKVVLLQQVVVVIAGPWLRVARASSKQ